jgi:hypothetical protein
MRKTLQRITRFLPKHYGFTTGCMVGMIAMLVVQVRLLVCMRPTEDMAFFLALFIEYTGFFFGVCFSLLFLKGLWDAAYYRFVTISGLIREYGDFER